jgi:hypothetical protein
MVVLPLFSGKAISTLRSWAFYNRWYRRKKAFLAGQGVDVQVIEKEIPPP